MIDKSDKVILVTGATGHQGGEAACSLLDSGWKVDAFTRGRSEKAMNTLTDMGARIVKGDMEDKKSLTNAMKGVYGVFLVTTFMDESGIAGEIKRGKMVADAAREAGVRHFIFSSVGAAERNTGIPAFESKREIELYIKNIGLKSTIFR